MMDLSVVPYETKPEVVGSPAGDLIATAARYRECMRNHAASLGGHAFDGCGEFMPSSAAPNDQLKCASGDSLKCAACGCHRNFHRRDGAASGKPLRLLPPPPGPFPAIFASPYSRIPPPQPAAARIGSETPPRMDGGEGSRKRMRTKFTADQKEKMQAFAEKLGWRIQKQDDVALEEFCVEIGVKRHVLKVWMHNNKHHFSSASPAAAAAAENGGKREGDVSPATAISV